MDLYHRFKENLISQALNTVNAYEVERAKEEKQQVIERQTLQDRVEQLNKKSEALSSQNQEWARKYEALNARLLPQLLPQSADEVTGQASGDQPTLGDFGRLIEENVLLRRKLKLAHDERKLIEQYYPETREARRLGRGGRLFNIHARDEHGHEFTGTGRDQGVRLSNVFHEHHQSKTHSENGQPDVSSGHVRSSSDTPFHNLSAFSRPTKLVNEAVSTDTIGGLPTPVSASCKELQSEIPRKPGHIQPSDSPSTSDDETSSETQFPIPRGASVEPRTRANSADESDYPMLVSERSLKRNRDARKKSELPPPRTPRSDDAGSPGAKRVKIEIESSSPYRDTLPRSTNRVNETMDLDEVGSRMKTPKKPRQSLHGTTSPENAQLSSGQDEAEEMLDRSHACEVLYERSQSEPVPRTIARSTRAFRVQLTGDTFNPLALQPKDANISLRKIQHKDHQNTPRTYKTTRLRNGRSIAVALMAEDGDTSHTRPKTASAKNERGENLRSEKMLGPLESRAPVYNQRLDKALNEPPAQTPVLKPKMQTGLIRDWATVKNATPKDNQKGQSPQPFRSVQSMAQKFSALKNTPRNILPTERAPYSPLAARGAFRTPPFENVADHRQDERLRSRSLESLVLGDFVMNLNAKQNYAFSEPVRSRDQRRCLATCTKPECCGTRFLKVAEIGGVAPFKSGLWSSLPPNEDEVDELRLLEHLDYDRVKLRTMSKTDKKNLVLHIKAQQMGNAIGRHKVTGYERAKTPPGFWRADMPSTQEVEEDREEARRLERRKVQERWHEAMAEDGKGLWKFRDE